MTDKTSEENFIEVVGKCKHVYLCSKDYVGVKDLKDLKKINCPLCNLKQLFFGENIEDN
jgi:DNA-directed RNA polymerase subunit RPC12/RpoP